MEKIKIESEIIRFIYEDNGNTVHFDYSLRHSLPIFRLDLYTLNIKTKEIFLLHQTEGTSKLDALKKMFDYVHARRSLHQQKEKNSYTVKWTNVTDSLRMYNVSYFYEATEDDVRTKFFYNKNKDDYIIDIKINPLA